MTGFPTELIRPPRPLRTRPSPPEPGPHRQILWYHVSCEGEGPHRTYVVRNVDDRVLVSHPIWEQLCDLCGWYPIDVASVSEGDTVVLGTARIRIAIPRVRLQPFAKCPTPPEIGEVKEIAGYLVSAKICKGANADQPIYYLRNQAGEVLSVAYDWRRWCQILGWFPLEGLEAGAPIPREPAADPKPRARTVPEVLNRHHYASRDEIPEPWIYVGRGHPLGNPFVPVTDRLPIRSASADDPANPEGHSEQDALSRYRSWLWDRLCKRDLSVLAALGKISAETNLVCSCAPRPCHADTIVKAWKWGKDRSVLDGYRVDPKEATPSWTHAEAEAAPQPPLEQTPLPASQAPRVPKSEPKNLDLFGGEP